MPQTRLAAPRLFLEPRARDSISEMVKTNIQIMQQQKSQVSPQNLMVESVRIQSDLMLKPQCLEKENI